MKFLLSLAVVALAAMTSEACPVANTVARVRIATQRIVARPYFKTVRTVTTVPVVTTVTVVKKVPVVTGYAVRVVPKTFPLPMPKVKLAVPCPFCP